MTNEELVTLIQRGEDREQNITLLWERTKAYIRKLARTYRKHADPDDLIQESYFALEAAARSYDPTQGVQFLTYAAPAIKRTMTRYIIAQCRAWEMPEYRAHRAARYERIRSDFQRDTGREPTEVELCRLLHCSVAALEDIEIDRLRLHVLRLDAPTSSDPDAADLSEIVPDPATPYRDADEKADRDQMSAELWELIAELPADQAAAIRTRYGSDTQQTRADTAAALGVTEAAARNLERKAIRALRQSPQAKALREYLDTTYSRALRGYDSTATTAINNVEREHDYIQTVEEWSQFAAGLKETQHHEHK